MPRALAKVDGYLVIAEFSRCNPGKTGKCPQCNPPHRFPRSDIAECQQTFSERDGWIECDDCNFAILKSDYDRMISEPYPFIGEHI